MALTTRTNGSSSGNIIQASWWNEYKDLLTGLMQDQLITLQNNLVLKALSGPPTSAPSRATAAGSNLGVGVYTYGVTFCCADGETTIGTTGTVTTTSGNTNVVLTNIPLGPVGTTARKIYRSKVNNSTLSLLTILANNTATTYTDSATDASLPPTQPPSFSTFGGSLIIKDSSGNGKWRLYNDGHFPGGTFFITPYTLLNGVGINAGETRTYTCWGGSTGVPVGASGVLLYVVANASNLYNYLNFAPHGGTLGSYPTVGNFTVVGGNGTTNQSFALPVDSNGQIDIRSNGSGSCQVGVNIYGYIG